MTVYKVDVEDRFQRLGNVEGSPFTERYSRVIAGQSLGSIWQPVRFYVGNPRLRHGDFYDVVGYLLVCPKRVAGAFGGILERDGELLPVEIESESEEHVLWNTTTSIDALDTEKTEFDMFRGKRGQPIRYCFKPELLNRPCLFRLPLYFTSILAVSGNGPVHEDFVLTYQRLGLKGLKLNPLWSSG